MENKYALIIEEHPGIGLLISEHLKDLKEKPKKIYRANNYQEAEKKINKLNFLGLDYFVLACSEVWDGNKKNPTSNLLENITPKTHAVMYSSGINKEAEKKLVNKKVHYAKLSSSEIGDFDNFCRTLFQAGIIKNN